MLLRGPLALGVGIVGALLVGGRLGVVAGLSCGLAW
jgi:hypothetical protein